MDEILILALVLNLILLVIAYFSASRAIIVVSSIVWVLIGFCVFESYHDVEDLNTEYLTLIMAITYLIAFAQIFIPLRRNA